MFLMIFGYLILLTILLLIEAIILFYLFSRILGSFLTGVPYISSPKNFYRQILELAELKPGENIYDLGSGDGELLLLATKEFKANAVGYELAPWPVFRSKLKARLYKQSLKVYRRDFFKADLSQSQVIFCYLYPSVMAKLEIKFAQELKPGTRVISFAFALPNRIPDQEVPTGLKGEHQNRILVYRY